MAAALTGDRARLLDELAAGRMSRAQVQVVVATLDRLPVSSPCATRQKSLLIDHARTLDASDLYKVGRYLVVVVDPDGDEGEAERSSPARARRPPRPVPDPHRRRRRRGPHQRPHHRRGRCRHQGRAFPLAAPTPTGTPATAGPAWPGAPLDGDDSGAGSGDDTASAPSSIGSCGVAGCGHDGRDPGVRRPFLDAFVDACRLLTVEVLPESHGSTPRITLTMDYTDLASGIGAATLDTGDVLSATPCGGSPATPTWCRWSSARRARCWTSAAPSVS